MSRIVVEVYVPATGRTDDVLVPYEGRLHEVTALVRAALAETASGSFTPDEDTVLCDRATGAVFNASLTLEELGLLNGAKLMLV